MIWVLAAICGVASIPAGLRWLRIAQREHYLPPSVSRFAWRWWTNGSSNLGLFALGFGRHHRDVLEPLVRISGGDRPDRSGRTWHQRHDESACLDGPIEASGLCFGDHSRRYLLPRRAIGKPGHDRCRAIRPASHCRLCPLGAQTVGGSARLEVGRQSWSQTRGSQSRSCGDHRLVREDDNQELSGPSTGRNETNGRQPCLFQQPNGAGTSHQ